MAAFLDGPGTQELRSKSCGACCGKATPKLSDAELSRYLPALPAWTVDAGGGALRRSFVARDFAAALDFFAAAGALAEAEGHHPDLHLTRYRHVEVCLSTHSIGGLSMADVVLAAKIDGIEVLYSPKWLETQRCGGAGQ